ncbi:MAG: hypothetical protein H0V43_14415 [Gemmatimonadales bacterium]|nr:hypothetical protein [Gemmatimonadales bacterium]
MFQTFGTIALLALLGCGSTAPDPGSGSDLRVLFIGNSLTYTHEIPELVAGLGEISDGPRVQVSEVAFGNYSLEDHWNRGDALDSIAKGGWDVVVMQQGPSTVPANRQHLIEGSTRFSQRIRSVGARPTIYMVWPPNGDFDAVARSYTDAALAVDGTLIPAGEAFRAVVRDHSDIAVFESDGFHPNPTGSYLAALVIYGRLADRPVAGVTLRRPVTGITLSQAAQLEAAADQANRDFGRD